MIIRKATAADVKSITCSLRNKHISYNTPQQAKIDIANGVLYLLERDNKKIAQCALIFDEARNCYAMKRLCLYNNKTKVKGVIQYFINFFIDLNIPNLSATPWQENAAMIHTLEKNGFQFQYCFLEHYLYYKKNIIEEMQVE